MEDHIKSENKPINGLRNEVVKSICTKWPDNITIINLSNSNIKNIAEEMKFPPKIKELNMSHNCLVEISSAIIKLECLVTLDLSYNDIVYFDDTPGFCHSIVSLDLSNNNLEGPPYWVWSKFPKKLINLDISSNIKITRSINEYYLSELIEYKTNLKEVKVYNCRLENHLDLFQTFPKANLIEIGALGLNINRNILKSVPCTGLDKCCDVKKLSLMNTAIYVISPNITIYKNITEIDLSLNGISAIPNEFCELGKLEICILSGNHLLYLPDDIVKLENLICLRLDSNELCSFPNDLVELPKLRILDLYDNRIYEISDKIEHIEELDLAMNYMNEPEDKRYCEQKVRMRLNCSSRFDGRKPVDGDDDAYSYHSTSSLEDEELTNYMNDLNTKEEEINVDQARSSPEDWDSDDCWVPSYRTNITPDPSIWISFVHRKMREGNFCPMDVHPVSVVEQVKYEKMNNPGMWKVYPGQFDDYSEDDS